ncbi:hypothetical protein CVT24_004461 [Panaeolus cyanescens]|uniref:Needs CLA4 to survive protein 3 n=1 Tax=Panaeolus cyanescens TaxID=181874 RepID=A0A409V9Y3_9AGAR|nr:hypothetical protein CVT24_004461 [Panaeolus cyanescens]
MVAFLHLICALLPAVALATSIDILYDGRAAYNYTQSNLDGSWDPYLTVVKGSESASHYTQLLGKSSSPTPLWRKPILPFLPFPSLANEQVLAVSIDNSSVFIPGGNVQNAQYGFRRTDIIAQKDWSPANLTPLIETGTTVFHFSIKADDRKPLNYKHEYQVVFIEPSDGSHVFGVQLGSPFTNPTGKLPAKGARNFKILDHALNVLFETPFVPGIWHNFAVQVDWDRITLAVLYSIESLPLKPVTKVVPNLSVPAGDAGKGEFHFGVLKLPLVNPADSPDKQGDVVHHGIQEGQLKLKNASILVVGAGGLGCPALQYLAAAGVGRLGIVDHDTVEISNLQRQILHNEKTVGMLKVESAAKAIQIINPTVQVDCITQNLNSQNAVQLLQNYDIILDCTDNAPTRYLLSDTAVALAKPLVSGAAQMFHGQLCTYNLGPNSQCYRCMFPKPPSPTATGTCEELGVLGAVTGVIGNLQALEAIKIITGLHDNEQRLLIFSALSSSPFRSMKLGAKKPTCPACGIDGLKAAQISETDYVQFCGGPRPDWIKRGLTEGESGSRVSVKEFHDILKQKSGNINVIDVRPPTEFEICQLPQTKNVLLHELVAKPDSFLPEKDETETYILCRLGNDSQIAAHALKEAADASARHLIVKDVIGGLRAWSREVDQTFPVY